MSFPSLHPTTDPPTLEDVRSDFERPPFKNLDSIPRFRYSLYNDVEVWSAWQAAVADPVNNASSYQIAASEKFTFYLMKVLCETVDDGDGCCMDGGVDDIAFGGFCLFQTGSQLDTYRLHDGDFNEMLASFKTS